MARLSYCRDVTVIVSSSSGLLHYIPCTLWRGNSLRKALWIFRTRQNVLVPPLSYVKRPEFLGVLQDLSVSQTSYITSQGTD